MTRSIDLVRDLQLGNFSGGMLKKDEIALRRRLANLTMISDIYNRTTGVTDVGYDDFGGDNADSIFKIDLTNTTSKAALPIGTTDLVPLVVNPKAGFTTGQEITIYDDVNMERVIATRAETVTTNVPHTVTTPSTITTAATATTYDTSGRRLVKLNNGWLVAVVLSANQAVYYVSKDDGQSWSSLCAHAWGTPSGYAIVSFGTTVYYVGAQTSAIYYGKVDAATIQFNDTMPVTSLDTQTSFGACSLAIHTDGTLHATWISKNSGYPNSFNIRYSKSTDNGATWAAISQLSTLNTSGANYYNPSIVIRSNGNPVIAAQYVQDTTAHNINVWYYNGSAWNVNSTIVGATYDQANPSAVIAPNGRIWVAWCGMDATDTSYYNIRVSYSDDGGVTWSAMQKLTTGNTNHHLYPSISVDKNNNVYLVCEGMVSGTVRQVRKIVNTGGIWGSITDLTSMTTANGSSGTNPNPSALIDNTLDFSDPLIIYRDATSSSVKFRGTWNNTAQTQYLQVQPLTKSYKTGAKVARTTAVLDTVNKCLKFDGYTGSVTNTITTPTTVVASSYDIIGNGGRKLTRLSNGWLIAGAINGSSELVFYVSKDNGYTWNATIGWATFGALSGGVSLVSVGTIVHFIICNSGGGSVAYGKFDATTQTNVGIPTNSTYVDSGQSTLERISLAVGSNGVLHAAWASKNSTYPNSFNIRYSKSTDGGATWAAVTTITVNNTAGLDNTAPCIVVKSDNNPVLFWQFGQPSSNNYMIMGSIYNGSWGFVNGSGAQKQLTASTYPQYYPSIAIAPNGRIWVSWYGYDTTDTSYSNIRISYSDDGGTTWSAMQKLTNGNTYHQSYPSVTVDKNNNAYVVFHGIDPAINTSQTQIRKIVWNGSTWSAITTLTNNTTGTATNPATLMDNTLDFTDPIVIYKDQQASALKFRGTWVVTGKNPVLVDDIRYTKVDTSKVDDTTFWIEYEKDPGLTVSAAYSSVDSSVTTTESYQSMLKNEQINPSITQTVVNVTKVEDTFNIGSPTRNDKGELRITISRTTTTIDKKITKVLGAVS
jgi:hypothetical protein